MHICVRITVYQLLYRACGGVGVGGAFANVCERGGRVFAIALRVPALKM